MNAQEIQGHWDQIRGKVKEKWAELTDDDLRLVEGNVEQVVGKIEQKTGEARRSVEAFLDDLVSGDSPFARAKEAVVDYSQAAVQTAREGMEQVSEQARQGYERAGEIVYRHPAESMALMLGVGFVTGLAAGVLMCSND